MVAATGCRGLAAARITRALPYHDSVNFPRTFAHAGYWITLETKFAQVAAVQPKEAP
jgi:hypothetical protein